MPKYLSEFVVPAVVLVVAVAARNSSDFALQNDERAAVKTSCAPALRTGTDLRPKSFVAVLSSRIRTVLARSRAMQLMENPAERFRKVNQLALSAKSAIRNKFSFVMQTFMQCTIFR